MVGLDQQSAPKQLINEVPSHVVPVNNKVGANSYHYHKSNSLVQLGWTIQVFTEY